MNQKEIIEFTQKEMSYKTSVDIYEPNEVIIFDLIGSNAHFRDFQTNSSSLSYYFPPPTVVYGLIAGIIGIKRDQYYSEFNEKRTFLAMDVINPVRKEIFTVNYQFYDEGGLTQIPVEILFPLDDDELRYRIYFSIQNAEFTKKIDKIIKKNHCVYPPYLGISEMVGRTEYIGNSSIEKVETNEDVELNSIFFLDDLSTLSFQENVILYPEYMRVSFEAGRQPGHLRKYFYKAKGEFRVSSSEITNLYRIAIDNKDQVISRL